MSTTVFGWSAAAALVLAVLVGGAVYLTQPQDRAAQSSQAALAAGGDLQEAETGRAIRRYLLKNPEVLVEAIEVLKTRATLAKKDLQKVTLASAQEALFQDPADPIVGAVDGDVAVVEFFDYQCPYCKQVAPGLKKELARDGKIRVVMKEFPILGEVSVIAARAALAADRQGKYEEFHWAMMTFRGSLSESLIFSLASEVGLDLDRLKADMLDPEITAQLQRVRQVAERLQISGTPAFVIGEELVPGALSMETFRSKVEQARDSQG